MNIADFRVEPADFIADFDDLRSIRETVFIEEQGIPEHLEFDGADPGCFHFIARDEEHNPIGTVRLSPDFKLGRMAVIKDWRKQGVGQALALAAINKARKLGGTEIRLDAQVPVTGFYEKLGFIRRGGIFNAVNIPHQAMSLVISPMENVSRPAPKPLDASTPATSLTDLEGNATAIIELINSARRQICVYTLNMEYELYGQHTVVNAFKQFAISSRGGVILIIIHDIQAVQSQAHPLFELSQRLPSSFQFRTPVEVEDLKYGSAYLANDRGGYLFRLFNNRYQGTWSPHRPARSRQLEEEFERVWQRSRPCTEFRALGI